MSEDAIVRIVLALIGTTGVGGLVTIWRGRRKPLDPPPPAPEPKAEKVAVEAGEGLVALAAALDALGRKHDALEGRVARCAVPDCPVRAAHFADTTTEETPS